MLFKGAEEAGRCMTKNWPETWIGASRQVMEQLWVTAGQAANYLVAPSAVRLDDRWASRGSVCERDKYANACGGGW